jgi:hypothetical protein
MPKARTRRRGLWAQYAVWFDSFDVWEDRGIEDDIPASYTGTCEEFVHSYAQRYDDPVPVLTWATQNSIPFKLGLAESNSPGDLKDVYFLVFARDVLENADAVIWEVGGLTEEKIYPADFSPIAFFTNGAPTGKPDWMLYGEIARRPVKVRYKRRRVTGSA